MEDIFKGIPHLKAMLSYLQLKPLVFLTSMTPSITATGDKHRRD